MYYYTYTEFILALFRCLHMYVWILSKFSLAFEFGSGVVEDGIIYV